MPIPLQNYVNKQGPVVSAEWLNQVDVQRFTILDEAQTKVQARVALSRDAGAFAWNGLDTGVVNAAVVSPLGQTGTLFLVSGVQVTFKAVATNTGPATLNFAGTGVRNIVNQLGNALVGGELALPVTVFFNGAAWQITSGGVGTTFARTAAEIAAGVTPVNYAYPPLDVRRYGGSFSNWVSVEAQATSSSEQTDNYHWQRVEPTSFAIGKSALVSTQVGALENFALGESALQVQTSGVANMAIGYRSCWQFTTGSFNTAVGTNTMLFYTNGLGFNTVVGYGGYARGIDGSNNVCMGFETLHDNGHGNQNVAIGSAALHSGTNAQSSPAPADPANCVAVGSEAVRYCYGSSNTGIGATALKGDSVSYSSTTESTAVGATCLTLITSGSYNVGVGSKAGQNLTTAGECVLVGQQAGNTLTTGGQNTMIGRFSGFYNATCTQNTFVGCYAGLGLVANAGGGQNVAVGFQSMDSHTSAATNNVAVGMNTLRNSAGINNTAVGFSAGVVVAGGTYNTLVGFNSGLVLSSGGSNSCLGQASGSAITTGGQNICVGDAAGIGITTGSRNVAIGSSALNQNGSNRICIGFNTQSSADNQINFGDTNIAQIRAQVTSITAYSDERLKKNIETLTIPDGFFYELRAVRFQWDSDKYPDGVTDAVQVGFIAQELDVLQSKYGVEWLALVDKSDPERWSATPGKLLFPLIAYVQSQNDKIKSLEERLSALEAKLSG